MGLPTALKELASIGKALGGLDWVQGPGGNASLKEPDGQLWIKASGVRLDRIADDGGCARVPLAEASAALTGNADAERRLFGHRPRPSLETLFHALAGRVVVHTHPVGSLVYACSSLPAETAHKRLERLAKSVEVHYCRPGLLLARAMQELRSGAKEQVFVLRNHGLVVVADEVSPAIRLTLEVDRELRALVGETRQFAAYARDLLATPSLPAAHGLLRPLPRRGPGAGRGRYLFPDAAVYATATRIPLAELDALARDPESTQRLRRSTVLEDPEGRRVLWARNQTELDQATEVIAAHDFVEAGLHERGTAVYLDHEEAEGIVSMQSEQYRMSLLGGAC